MEIPDVTMETSQSKCVSTVFLTSRHFDENGMCHNSDDARLLSFALQLHCCVAKSARPWLKRQAVRKGGALSGASPRGPPVPKGMVVTPPHCVWPPRWDRLCNSTDKGRVGILWLSACSNLEDFWSQLALEPSSLSHAVGHNSSLVAGTEVFQVSWAKPM